MDRTGSWLLVLAACATVLTCSAQSGSAQVSVDFDSDSYQVTEGGTSMQLCVTLLDNATATDNFTVTIMADPGGEITLASDTLEFTVSDTMQCTTITAEVDDRVEDDDMVQLTLASSNETIADVSMAAATVTVIDNSVPNIVFSESTYSVAEMDGQVEVCVNVTSTLERSVTVEVTTQEGGATAGDDYTALPATDLMFDASTSQDCVDITIVLDTSLELVEDFTVSATTNGLASPVTATVSITDSTTPTIEFSESSYSVAEADGLVKVCVNVTSTLERSVTVEVTTQDGGATAGVDYTALPATDLMFDASTSQVCVDITIQPDNSLESVENFTVSATTNGLASPVTATVSITDSTMGIVALDEASYTVEEGTPFEVCVTLTDATADSPVTVTLTPVGDTAIAGIDFSTDPVPVTIAGTSGCGNASTLSDSTNEAEVEMFMLVLESDDNRVTVNGTANQTTVNIFDPPVVVTQPLDQLRISISANVSFSVTATGTELMYQWQRDGEDVSDGPTYQGANTPDLMVTNAQADQAGEYTCVVTNAVGSDTSNTATLTFLGMPTISPEQQAVEEGGQAMFFCNATGENLSYSWITTAPGVDLSTATSNTLTVTATNSSSGQYRCVVMSANSEQTSPPATLTVIAIADIITSHPSPVPEGVNLTLSCVANGSPNITYQWERIPTLAGSETLMRVPFGDRSSSVLVVQQVGPEDTGNYTCTVTVGEQEIGSRTITIDTEGLTFLQQLPSSDVLREGGELRLSVSVLNPDGAPSVTFIWYKGAGGSALSASEDSRVNIVSGPVGSGTWNSTLTITGLVSGDDGVYLVRVFNSRADNSIESSSNITVLFLPSVSISIIGNPVVDADVTLTCSGDANPPIANLTIVNGTGAELCSNSGADSLDCTLDNLALTDSGTYTCVAYNADGRRDATYILVVTAKPDPVDLGTVQSVIISLRTVNLRWEEPADNNSPITMYTVSHCEINNRTAGTCEADRISLDTPHANISLSDLSPMLEYSVTIVATNDVGTSAVPSTPYRFDTVTTADVAPLNFRTGQVTESLVMLLWDVSAIAARSAPAVFRVMYRRLGDGQFKQNLTTDTAAVVGGLDERNNHIFQVVTVFETPVFESELRELNASTEASGYLVGRSTGNVVAENDSITMSWPGVTAEEGRQFLQGYRVELDIEELDVTVRRRKRQMANPIRVGPDETSATINMPEPYSNYTAQVFAEFEVNGSPFSSAITDPTTFGSNQGQPSPPLNLEARDVSYRSLNLMWDRPTDPNGILHSYTITYTDPNGNVKTTPVSDVAIDYSVVPYNLTRLIPATTYSISVTASNDGGTRVSVASNIISANTIFDVTEPSIGPVLQSVDNTFFISNVAFETFPGEIGYCKYVLVRDDPIENTRATVGEPLRPSTTRERYSPIAALTKAARRSTFTIGSGETELFSTEMVNYTNARLETDRRYFVFIRVYSDHDDSVFADSPLSGRFSIESDDEDDLDPVPIIVPIAVIALVLLIVFVVLLFVALYTRRPRTRRRHVPSDGSVDTKRGKAVELRRTRIFSPTLNVGAPDVFTSAGQPTTLLCEASGTPAPEVHWTKEGESLDKERFIQLADSSLFINDTDLQDEGKYLVTAENSAGSAEQLVQVTVIRPVPPEPDSDHPPIKMGEFSEKLARLKLNDDEGLEDEYADLELDWNFTSYASKLAVNKNKSRYVNIIPYDHSRVVLNLQDNTPGSDYINASFIDGYDKPNAYIASQGPIPSTFADFWRMVWELDCPTIVMVTNLKEDEKVKCNQYWPSYGTTTYGAVQVTLKEVENLAEYSIRTFNVSPIAGQSKAQMPVREVRQFHFVVWPDHGVPQYATPLLSFRKRVHKYHPERRGPMVVHCSAGVGRTGTFITIDYIMKQIEAEGVLDIFNFVRNMRYRRNYMVQTAPQYVFIYEALFEAIMCGDTSIAAPDLKAVLADMQKVDNNTGKTGLQTQFETLTKASPADEEFDCTVAQLADNMAKNRFKKHLPPNEFRVILSPENEQSDYICASFVDGYRQRNSFITTQAPLDSTIGDFWRMIWEHRSAAIVMLMEVEEEGGVVKYWPGEVGQPETYGHYQVELSADEREVGDYTTRRFKLSHVDKPQESRWITQFHFHKWPKSSCPSNAKTIIDLIDELQRVQRKSGNGPITVHCDDGIGRTGTFCGLYAVVERVKIEQVVDVFQSIKTVRIQRPGLMESQDQYEFIYKAVLEFLDSFSDYQNFK